jgi:hypothetical protein
MKCITCETEINPKWKHAIDINVCPFCGKHIMEEHLKNCIASLATAMEEMLKYPEQLEDWLLSNHNYIKTDSHNLLNYISKEDVKKVYSLVDKATRPADPSPEEPKVTIQKLKVPDGKGGFTIEEIIVEKTQSEAQTNSFFDRAEVLKGAGKSSGKAPKAADEPEAPKSVVEKTANLKKLAQQIRTEVSQGVTGESGLAVMMRPDMIDNADPDAVAEFQAAITSGDIIASGLPPVSDGDDEIPSAVLKMASRATAKGSNTGGGANEKDMQTLQEMQAKVRGAQNRLASGKGGFSRA